MPIAVEHKLVQWALLREENYLRQCLNLSLARKLAEELTTDFGRIDFAYELSDGRVAIVELETAIDSAALVEHCTEQLSRYQRIRFGPQQPVVVLLFDRDRTPPAFQAQLEHFASSNSIELRDYSIAQVLELYKDLMEQLRKSAGISLGRPLAMDVVYLRWLNRLILPFYRGQSDSLTEDQLRVAGGFRSQTSFGVHCALAENFELIERRKTTLFLTGYGKQFKGDVNLLFVPQGSRANVPNLSTAQKRVLVECLLNGNFIKSKVNIYYFLRFLHLTAGEWVPKARIAYDGRWHELVKTFLGVSYNWNTLTKFLRFALNHCEELELVTPIPIEGANYYRAVLTPLGSRVLGFLELYLHLKREQVQIPLDL